MKQKERAQLIEQVFDFSGKNLEELYLQIFMYQYKNCSVYHEYCKILGITENLSDPKKIPFLPISFFKTKRVTSGSNLNMEYFASSGTTGMVRSKHFISDIELYERSFLHNFISSYGAIENYSVLGLLPSYLEQKQSSLIYMVEHLIKKATKFSGDFYLNDVQVLRDKILHNEEKNIATIVFGVTYALLDFAELYPMALKNCTIIETGGMKGRKKEITRDEVHDFLCQQFSITSIHSEYGMTELFAQTYSKGRGIYYQNDLLQVCLRADDDPFYLTYTTHTNTTGLLNVIDLANIDSCSFIATDDIAILRPDGSFSVEGRADHSDIRGCSLLSL